VAAPIRVVIVDDHRLVREGLRRILAAEAHVEIVGEAADGLQAIGVVSDLKPDVVLLDINMPEMDGIEAIPAIREESPEIKPLMFSAYMDEATIFRALKAGAKGYLLKDAASCDLIKAIQAVHRGEVWVERELMARFIDEEAGGDFPEGAPTIISNGALTPREREVLRCLARGWTNKEIADALYISEKTVKSHLTSIFKKLKVPGRFRAMLHAVTLGLK
jgi:DNA-binding NarL/FixJ family response regulator